MWCHIIKHLTQKINARWYLEVEGGCCFDYKLSFQEKHNLMSRYFYIQDNKLENDENLYIEQSS